MIEFLLFAKAEVEQQVQAGKTSLTKKTLTNIEDRYSCLIANAKQSNEEHNKAKLSKFEDKAINLIKRLETY